MKILEDNKNSKYEDLLSILSVADTKSDEFTQEDKLIETLVKYRIKEAGELKLKSLTVYLDYNLKSILYSEKDNVPDKYEQFQKQVSIYSSTIENNYKVINSATELIELINKNMK